VLQLIKWQGILLLWGENDSIFTMELASELKK
jgi:hypothetical protein